MELIELFETLMKAWEFAVLHLGVEPLQQICVDAGGVTIAPPEGMHSNSIDIGATDPIIKPDDLDLIDMLTPPGDHPIKP